MKNNFDELLNLIEYHSPTVRSLRIQEATTICGGLGICGEDAWELIEAYAENFNVDIEGLNLQAMFGNEGWGLIDVLLIPLRLLIPSLRPRILEITIGDLLIGAQNGRLPSRFYIKCTETA